MKIQNMKFRRTTEMDMSQRPHSTPKGKRGYDRAETRQAERNWKKELDECR